MKAILFFLLVLCLFDVGLCRRKMTPQFNARGAQKVGKSFLGHLSSWLNGQETPTSKTKSQNYKSSYNKHSQYDQKSTIINKYLIYLLPFFLVIGIYGLYKLTTFRSGRSMTESQMERAVQMQAKMKQKRLQKSKFMVQHGINPDLQYKRKFH